MSSPRALLALASTLFIGHASAQDPTDIPGLQLWLDATDGSTITSSGGTISQWDDKSGNGFHAVQADPARQPSVGAGTLLGQNSIRFDGTIVDSPDNDGMTINDLDLQRPYSVVMLDQIWGTEGGRTLHGTTVNWLTGRWNGNPRHFTGGWVGGNGGGVVGPAPPAFTTAVGTSTTNNFTVDSGNHTVGVNNVNFASPGGVAFGSVGLFEESSQADVGEVIIVNRALTDSDRNTLAQHVGNNWNVPVYLSNNATRTQTFTGADPGEGLDFSGNFVAAVNAGQGVPVGQTIGDATFTNDTGVVSAENQIPNWFASSFNVDTPADTDLNTIMQSIRWTNTGNGGQDDLTTTVGGLTVGNTYKLQMMFADAASNRHFTVGINGDQVSADFQQAAHTGNTTNIGVAMIHEFVAEAETLEVIFESGTLTGPDQNPLIQGLTVEDRGITGITTTGTFANAAELDLTGSFTHAIDFAGPGGIVGDANFTSDAAAVTLFENTALNWTAPDYGATADDDALELIMGDIRWTATNNHHEELGVQLDGLTIGQPYQLQLLWDEQTSVDRTFDVMIDGILVADDFSTTDSFGNALGSVLTHTFTAGDDLLNITLDGFSVPVVAGRDYNPTFHALTLEAIPEPSSAALVGIATLCMISRRRRR